MALVLVLLSLLVATAILVSGLRWPHAFVLIPVAIATGAAAIWMLFLIRDIGGDGCNSGVIYLLRNMIPAYLIGGAILVGYTEIQRWRRRRGNSPAGNVGTESGTQPAATWWRLIAAVTLLTVPLGIATATHAYEPGGWSLADCITLTDDFWDTS